jgi:hypothetical protein
MGQRQVEVHIRVPRTLTEKLRCSRSVKSNKNTTLQRPDEYKSGRVRLRAWRIALSRKVYFEVESRWDDCCDVPFEDGPEDCAWAALADFVSDKCAR